MSSSTIYGNYQYGMLLYQLNDQVTITGSTFYGVTGGTHTDDQSQGIYLTGTMTYRSPATRSITPVRPSGAILWEAAR